MRVNLLGCLSGKNLFTLNKGIQQGQDNAFLHLWTLPFYAKPGTGTAFQGPGRPVSKTDKFNTYQGTPRGKWKYPGL